MIRTSQVVKNPSSDAGDSREVSSVPGWGRSPGGGNGTPLQDSCLENPTDRGAWQAIVHGVAKSRTPEHTHSVSMIVHKQARLVSIKFKLTYA